MRYVEVPPAEREALLRGDYAEALRLYKQSFAEKVEPTVKPRATTQTVEGRHWSEKLTPREVKEIRSSKESGRVLAARYGISEATVGAIRRRERYRWIK